MRHPVQCAACYFLAVTLVAPAPLLAQAAAATAAPAAAAFSESQLEQLVAPIALYPDSLLSQILMASTYPLEIVQAARWLSQNKGLTGSKLEEGLKEHEWDPSVKSLCGFPDVLTRMSDNLEWTQDLGDAVLAQRAQVMDSVQVMRGKAYEAGSLETTEQQVVTQQPDKIIVIQSSDPEVIYVPTYSPTVVYVGWGYSSWYYPALYPVVRPGYGALAFTAGVVWGAAVWGNCNWGWGRGDVNIDINRQNNFNRNTSIDGGNRVNANRSQGGNSTWNHDASHRKGVNYRDGGTAKKYGGSGTSNRVTQDQARGRSNSATASQRPSTGAAQRPSTGAAQRPSTGAAQRPSTGGSSSSQPRNNVYSGASGSSSSSRSASSRGASSRGSTSYGGSRSGGASRGGGGGRR